jgi:predicted RNA-binding protein with PIN domain
VARERERTRAAKEDARRARDEARRVKQESRRELSDSKARAAALEEQIAGLQEDLERAGAAAEEARREAARRAADHDRELRRATRRAESAAADRAARKGELGEERKKVAALERLAGELETRLARFGEGEGAPPRRAASAHGRASRSPTRARRRRALRPPKGRLPDEPGTLEEWLARDDVRLLVDGYNVTKAPGGFAGLDITRQRERLIEEVVRLARRKDVPATIVFDGSEVAPGTARRSRGPVDVQYSVPPESADDHLVALLRLLPPDPVIVVSDDRELRERAAAHGATPASSRQLLTLIR